MAAIMALIMLPVVAAVGFMLKANLGHSVGATIATLMFAALAFGVFGGLVKMARRWEDETP